jgi:hypothetical protein
MLMGSLVLSAFPLYRGVFDLCLPINSFRKSFFKQFVSLLRLSLSRVEALMVKLILKHEKLCALVVTLLLKHDAVFKHGTFKGNETKVVVILQLTECLGDESDGAFIVEHAAE